MLIKIATISLGAALLIPLAFVGGDLIAILLASTLLAKELFHVSGRSAKKLKILLNGLLLPLSLLFIYHIAFALFLI